MRAAGRALGLSQPTIARRLAAFEATFGGPTLFDRLPEGLRLNGPVRAARRILHGQVRSGLSPGRTSSTARERLGSETSSIASRLESPSVSPKYPSLRRNRRFESIPLLRGVTCEPELSPIGLRRPSGAAAKRPARPSILFPGTLKSPRSPKAKHHTIQTNIGGAAVFVAAAFPKQHDVTRLEFSYCSPLPKLPGGCRQPPASIALCLWGRRFPVARADKKRDPGLETTGNPVNVG
jgi:hypothetical protein